MPRTGSFKSDLNSLTSDLRPLKSGHQKFKSDLNPLKFQQQTFKPNLNSLTADLNSLKFRQQKLKSDLSDRKSDLSAPKFDLGKLKSAHQISACTNRLPSAISGTAMPCDNIQSRTASPVAWGQGRSWWGAIRRYSASSSFKRISPRASTW